MKRKTYYLTSDDFLSGKIPFYYAYVFKKGRHQKFSYVYCDCTIFNKDKIIGNVKRNSHTILMPATFDATDERWDLWVLKNHPDYKKYQALYETYNYLITKETKYISDVDNDKGLIRFYKLTENSLELVNELSLNKQCFYETHFATCGNRFVIFEGIQRIFLYNVDTGKIEYENEIYFAFPYGDEPDKKKAQALNESIFIFLTNLLLYAHAFQDSYFHAFLNKDNEVVNEVVLIPIKKWNAYKKLSEFAKGFLLTKEPHTSPRLRI